MNAQTAAYLLTGVAFVALSITWRWLRETPKRRKALADVLRVHEATVDMPLMNALPLWARLPRQLEARYGKPVASWAMAKYHSMVQQDQV